MMQILDHQLSVRSPSLEGHTAADAATNQMHGETGGGWLLNRKEKNSRAFAVRKRRLLGKDGDKSAGCPRPSTHVFVQLSKVHYHCTA